MFADYEIPGEIVLLLKAWKRTKFNISFPEGSRGSFSTTQVIFSRWKWDCWASVWKCSPLETPVPPHVCADVFLTLLLAMQPLQILLKGTFAPNWILPKKLDSKSSDCRQVKNVWSRNICGDFFHVCGHGCVSNFVWMFHDKHFCKNKIKNLNLEANISMDAFRRCKILFKMNLHYVPSQFCEYSEGKAAEH